MSAISTHRCTSWAHTSQSRLGRPLPATVACLPAATMADVPTPRRSATGKGKGRSKRGRGEAGMSSFPDVARRLQAGEISESDLAAAVRRALAARLDPPLCASLSVGWPGGELKVCSTDARLTDSVLDVALHGAAAVVVYGHALVSDDFSLCASSPSEAGGTPPRSSKAGTARTTCLTGGAMGSDAAFAQAAARAGCAVHVCSFEGHKRMGVPAAAQLLLLDDGAAAEADCALTVAGKRLGRPWQPEKRTEYVRGLIRRNHSIARGADAVFAVSRLVKRERASPLSVGVQGGTGWTCQMFADKVLASTETKQTVEALTPGQSHPLNLFLFEGSAWRQCFAVRKVTVSPSRPPVQLVWRTATPANPTVWAYERAAGVGTRHPGDVGRAAIDSLFRRD